MDCQRIKEYLLPFISGGLNEQIRLRVKEHISSCPLCALEWEEEKKIDSLIRINLSREKAPFALKERILHLIKQPQKVKILSFALPQLKPALAVTLIILLIALIGLPALLKDEPFPAFAESVDSHIKFLQGGLPLEITSGNPQEIKNWFRGKLNFAITVPDLSQSGANLIGARLCHLEDQKAALLIYEKDGRIISVFIIDSKGLNIARAERRVDLEQRVLFVKRVRGYQSMLCLREGCKIVCIFVSDLSEDELMRAITYQSA